MERTLEPAGGAADPAAEMAAEMSAEMAVEKAPEEAAEGATPLRLFFRLQQAAHHIKRAADKALIEAASVSTAQAAALRLVAERRALSQRELADALGLKEPAVAAMVARLEKLGYLTRRRAAEDGRAWRLAVAPGGETALAAMAAPFAAFNAAMEAAIAAPLGGADPRDARGAAALFAAQLCALSDRFDEG